MSGHSTPQNLGSVTVVPTPFDQLTLIQRSYIDWKALGGIVTDDSGPHKLTLVKLGEMLNVDNPVHHTTLSHSCDNVHDFWDLVAERRKHFNSTSRIAYLHERWYVAAATVKNWPVTEAYLRNFDPNYREAKQKVEHEMGDGIAELVLKAQQANRIQERKVIDATTDENQSNSPTST